MQPRGFIGASDVAALFGEHPYDSRYSLYMRETGMRTHESDEKTERQQLGLDLEEAIVKTWARRENATIVLNRDSLSRWDIPGLGATPDALRLVDPSNEPVDAKTVMPHERRAWLDGVPRHYWWQSQAQSLVCGADRGWMVALFGVQELSGTAILADAEAHERIRQEVETFWRQVRGEVAPPEPDGHRATVDAMMTQRRERKTIDFGDERIAEMMAARDTEYLQAKLALSAAKKREKAAKAAILAAMGDADCGVFGDGSGYRIDWQERKATTVKASRFPKLTRFTGDNTEDGEDE